MKFIDEYRDPALARTLLAEIAAAVRRPWVLMEICGGHTHAIIRHGIDQLLPPEIELVHGPGCPVCVTPAALIDQAIALARRPEVIFTSFGDMLRVPGSVAGGLAGVLNTPCSLQQAQAAGADVRMVYSPLEAVELARQHPHRQVVFFAVGFETTAPGNAMAVLQAARLGLSNFSLLVSHVLVPPAIAALLAAPDNRVQGFLAAGHVCTVTGWEEYRPLVERYRVPMVPAGFEPVDILAAILMLVRQLEAGRAEVENEYRRAVRRQGNPAAQAAVEEVFMVTDRDWRGLGVIPRSGLRLRPEFAAFDAAVKMGSEPAGEVGAGTMAGESAPATAAALISSEQAANPCISGAILRGVKKPLQCPAFAAACHPENPLGATMVSQEGACHAYYRANRRAAA
ncbi:MAG: hydrogenase formation protein HypD [Desulfurivibrio sp.]|nr:hydrogenase formation protein HypD [Desulfurivibrio sp.]